MLEMSVELDRDKGRARELGKDLVLGLTSGTDQWPWLTPSCSESEAAKQGKGVPPGVGGIY
jgi:hypothetical protein